MESTPNVVSQHKAVFKRLLKEFWFPATVAIAWVAYRSGYSGISDAATYISTFASSFFLASWATGQFFRVQKQTHVDRSFQNIEQRLESLIELLERRTADLIGYTMGGDDAAFFAPTFYMQTPTVLVLNLMNSSKYPAHDLQIDWIDLDGLIDPSKGQLWTRHPMAFPSLWVSDRSYPSLLCGGFDAPG